MKQICKVAAFALLSTALVGPSAFAQDHHDNHHYVRHEEWKKGEHIKQEDWNRGDHIDYRKYHLHAPPSGYEWREVDGNFVMAAIATGVISTVIAESAAH